jgi:hypothetical protein
VEQRLAGAAGAARAIEFGEQPAVPVMILLELFLDRGHADDPPVAMLNRAPWEPGMGRLRESRR